MTDKNDLKPGDVVQHPEKGYGIVHRHADNCVQPGICVTYCIPGKKSLWGRNYSKLDDWEHVDVVKPGHVQVRVDDLDPQTLSEWSQYTVHSDCDSVLVRTGRAFIGQQVEHGDPSPHWRAESTPTADEQDANVEAFPRTVMVELRCPHGCGAPVRAKLSTEGYSFPEGGAWPRLVAVPQHICQPAQPDEPTGLGAVVEVGGKRFVRTDEDGHPWIDNVAYWHTWDEITARGPVTVLSEGLPS